MRALGASVGTGVVSCEWADHPRQRHKLMREPAGDINPFRRHYGVRTPLRFHTRTGNPIDEVPLYRHLRERPPTPRGADGLTILLAGELAYNAERVLALEERGHTLYGLWTDTPAWFDTVGPLPFGTSHGRGARACGRSASSSASTHMCRRSSHSSGKSSPLRGAGGGARVAG